MKITLVTTMRNEGPHLLEWIAHHRAAGVSDFLVYTNDCEDGTEALLDLLPDVTHVPLDDGKKPPQWRALRAAWDHPAVAEADWVACMDCDEFINLGSGLKSIPDLISKVDADMILLPWRLFGHAGKVDLSQDLTIGRFTRAAPENLLYPAIGSYFKSLFRRDGPFRQLGVHRPKQKNPDRHDLPRIVDGSGVPVAEGLAANDGQIMFWGAPIARDLVQLNHYSVRSISEFILKRARGLPNHQQKQVDLTYWVERNFNTVEDDTIASMAPATRSMMQELLALDGVADTQAACRAWHRQRFDELMQDPDTLKLYGRLLLSEGSAHLPDVVALDLIRRYGQVHGSN
ncbi:glycosyl transferase family 2 [Litoreibacter meonggei]|uniref:Glycosyl transferase family 2 n=1 Tax=Litoreibacter meonggei TaxID=1049199 RepID=A0A497VH19_9RHOB|nr:glycosyltransferase family 2 protein [Litoreibacter meonggei]RLJ41537.1 glycosyl transferase family 2 [Litoreibacter meonggei]